MILDNLSSGLLTVDGTGRIVRINPMGQAILGLRDRSLGDTPIAEGLGKEAGQLAELVLDALADGERRKRQEVTVQREGKPVPLGVNVDFLSADDGTLVGAVIIFSDLTEVRRLRDHLRRSDRLAGVGELAASIAHELRNPLASIRGSVELLSSELQVHDQHAQLMELILRESNRLNTIITDFLVFARMRPTQARPIALDGFLEDLQFQLQQHVAASGHGVEVHCRGYAPDLHLAADPEQLTQAILNLAINACEAMHGQGRLDVLVGRADEGCEVCVRDSGPGLPPDSLEDIFTPFVTTKQHGTGLGLPMVARIVHGHGGTVEARNNPAGGAEFVLRLPLASPEPEPNGVTANVAEMATAGTH